MPKGNALTTKTEEKAELAMLPRTIAQPLEVLAGNFQILCQLQDGTGCLGGSMPGALRTLAQELREGNLSRDRARYTFTGCSGYLQQALGSMLWRDFQKGATPAHQWRFTPDEDILNCLDRMSEAVKHLGELIAPFEHGRPEPTIYLRLKDASKSFGEIRQKPELAAFHQAMGKLSMAFIELSMAV